MPSSRLPNLIHNIKFYLMQIYVGMRASRPTNKVQYIMLIILPEWFIRYKFFNSLFLGLSVGAIFTLYAPLEPSIYSLGGVFLPFFD